MGYKTYTQQLNSLRQDIIASIKEYLRKNVGNNGSLDLSDEPVMCDQYEVLELETTGLKVRPVYPLSVTTKKQKPIKLKYEQMFADDLRKIHSRIVTGSELI